VKRALVTALVVLSARAAAAQTLSLHVDSRDLFVGLPFVLSVEAKGFDEKPEPKLSALAIPGARVTYLGVSPNVATTVQIVNGQVSQHKDVSYVYRYRIETQTAGSFAIPSLTAEQGPRRAQTRPVSFQTRDMDKSPDMRVQLTLPTRPVWVGETFDVALDWYLRRDVGDRTFVVPLFDAPGMAVEGAPAKDKKTLGFAAGAKEIQLPYERSQASVDGATYTRFRFSARVTPQNAGSFDLLPTRVVANLQVGQQRDFFGFAVPQSRLFKAEDVGRKLEVRPLPLSDRPKSFAGAVGTAFAITAQADRTVVSVGDPIELAVTVRGKGRLEGLTLPAMDSALESDHGASAKWFAWPDESPAGETIDDGKGKLFRLAVRLKSAEAREIPPLPLSYFDPELGQYRTVRSQPIALSVRGSAVVAGKDVIRTGAPQPAPSARADTPAITLAGVDLALSRADRTLRKGASLAGAAPFLFLLYGGPVLFCLVVVMRRRNQDERRERSDIAAARRRLENALHAAQTQAARESAPLLMRALTELARKLEVAPAAYRELATRIETEAFDPKVRDVPLAQSRRDEVRALALGWREPTKAKTTPERAGALLLLAGLAYAGHDRAWAAPDSSTLGTARQTYQQALADTDHGRRTSEFAQAESAFRELAAEYPDRPELLADWGNAALGAQDVGRAVLAYRRALAIAPRLERASSNLSWARKQLPAWVPHPHDGGAFDSLLFWRHALAPPERHLLAAAVFGLGVLMLAGRRTRKLAAVPLAAWLLVFAQLVLEQNRGPAAVVTADGISLRSADSLGAPQVLDKPLPSGTECSVLEERDTWLRVQLAEGGATGWIRSGSAELVGS
jgi:hypothetical protein